MKILISFKCIGYLVFLFDEDKFHLNELSCVSRLDGRHMLELLRGKRLVFVGDSLNRNMWESLICILKNFVKDQSKVYEASGKRQFRSDAYFSFIFKVSSLLDWHSFDNYIQYYKVLSGAMIYNTIAKSSSLWALVKFPNLSYMFLPGLWLHCRILCISLFSSRMATARKRWINTWHPSDWQNVDTGCQI